MDTRMIEVALGLALVFALSSLLVTAMRELWASAWGSRSKVLHMALVSFLGDDKDFAQKLMKAPLLVSLSRDDRDGKPRPSYMGADMVVTALIASLVDDSMVGIRPSTPLQFVEALRRRGQVQDGPNHAFLTSLQSLIHGVENDWPGYEARLRAWYDAVNDRSIGWFKRSNQKSLLLLGFIVAAAANINPIIIATHLWQDAPMRQALASAAEKAGNAYSASFAQTTEANSDAEKGASAAAVRAATSAARANLHERRSKEQIATEQALDEVKGALEGAKEQLASHPVNGTWQSVAQAYDQLLHLRSRLDIARKSDDGSPELLRQKLGAMREMDETMHKLNQLAAEATPTHPLLSEHLARLSRAVISERARIAAGLDGDSRHQNCIDPRNDAQAQEFCERLRDLNTLKGIGLPVGWSPFLMPEVFASDCVNAAAAKAQNACWDTSRAGNLALVLVGWLLTAIAASLGAPFWFDLLGKLAKLRAAGTKPPSTGEGEVSGGSPSPPSGNGSGSGSTAASGPSGGMPPGSSPPSNGALNGVEKDLAESEIRRLQRELMRLLKRSDLAVNGVLDGSTRDAIRQWQSTRHYTTDGELTERQLSELLNHAGGNTVPPTAPASRPPVSPIPTSSLSGAQWAKKFPGSADIAASAPNFAHALKGFVDAMRHAGAQVEITATFRPPERAYLMHYAWRIAHEGLHPQDVPPKAGVEIDWVHRDAAGAPDLKRSRNAALDMVASFGLVTRAALQSRHTDGCAVDMTIGWNGELRIPDADGSVRTIIDGPRNGTHPQLVACGATYGVIKARFANDPPHWSDNGH